MKRSLLIIVPLLFALLGPMGCGSSSSDNVEAPKKAAQKMQNVFDKAAPNVKRNVQVAADAMKQNQYEKAFVALRTVEAQPHLTYEQSMAARASMHSMQESLARAVVEGDQNALRAARAIRAMQPR